MSIKFCWFSVPFISSTKGPVKTTLKTETRKSPPDEFGNERLDSKNLHIQIRIRAGLFRFQYFIDRTGKFSLYALLLGLLLSDNSLIAYVERKFALRSILTGFKVPPIAVVRLHSVPMGKLVFEERKIVAPANSPF